ncbi:MAG: PAS domain S-box protein [Oscillochloris sp.]|nr:PAS domain S-box protein [Oscillochloris sp.]
MRFRKTFDTMLEGIQILGFDWRYIYLNQAAEGHNRRSNQELLGNTYTDIWPGIESTDVYLVIKRCFEERVASHVENRFVYPDGFVGWFNLSIQPVTEGTLILSFDITERVTAERQLAKIKHLYATLSQINQAIVHIRSTAELYQSICDNAVKFGGFRAAWIGLFDVISSNVRPVATHGFDIRQWPFPISTIDAGPANEGLVAAAIRTATVVTSNDLKTDQRLLSFHNQFEKYSFRASAAIPFRLGGQVIGVLSLTSSEVDFFKGEENQYLLNEMGLSISFALDKIESERAKKEAEKIRRQWADAFEHCAHGIAIGLPATNQFLSCNSAFAHLQGRSVEEITSMPILSMYAPQDHTSVTDFMKEADDIGNVQFEAHMVHKDGHIYLVQMDIVSVRDENGDLLYRVITQQDITARKQAEWALRTSEEKYRGLIGSLNSIVFTVDYDGTILYMNDVATRHLGGTCRNPVGEAIYDLLIEPVATEQLGYIRNVIQENTGFIYESQNLVPGKSHWYRTTIYPIHDGNGQAIYALVNATDIHDLKTTQHELLELNRTLEERVKQRTAEVQDLYDRAPIGYHSLNANGIFVMVNQTERDWLGYTSEEMIGHHLTEFVTPSSLEIFPAIFPIFKRHGVMQGLEIELTRKDGSILPVLLGATAIYDDAGHFVMSRSTVVDITQRREIESVLRQANADLARVSQAKDEFLANTSHELRTPLNTILGFSEILLELIYGPLNERQQAALRSIETSGRHLLTLINDILDLSRVAAGRLDLRVESVSITELCHASMELVHEAAIKKSLLLVFELNEQQATIEADPKRLKQMLVNLLSNAVKFTPSGGQVRLEVTVDAEAEEVRFTVQDTGIGIAHNDLARLFQPFSQLDSSLSRQYEGNGLGLALVQRLADLHGGTVMVSSEVGVGSCFIVVLPNRLRVSSGEEQALHLGNRGIASHQIVAGSQHSVNATGVWILLTEDNESNIQTTCEYLQIKGYQVAIARNGYEAIEKAEAMRPNLILMDIQMPKMDGLEAIRRLRTMPAFAHTPIIALTALAMPGDRERCMAAGASEYLIKPVRLKGLLETIKRLCS